jgi:Peptidase family M28/PDZ domain
MDSKGACKVSWETVRGSPLNVTPKGPIVTNILRRCGWKRRGPWAVVVAAALWAVPWSGQSPTPAAAAEANAVEAALRSISAEEMQQCVNMLADDSFEGRETGSRGGRAACAYIGGLLQKRHAQGAGIDGGLYQDFGVASRNILARLSGSDPRLKDQYIIVSAHYDHVGYGKPNNSFGPIGYIHKGADDNASGVAGLLSVIDAFNKLPEHPKRSVLFAFWDGEEQGLLGSRYWLKNPTVPLDHVAIVLNMDMIGRLRKEKVEVYGTRTSYNLRRIVSQENEGSNLLLDFHWEMRADSDHYPFFEKHVPVLMLHTGLHSDYHRPSDTADKINPAGMRDVAQLMFRTALDLAETDSISGFRERSREENAATEAEVERPLPPLPGRFGVSWDDAAEKERGLRVARVAADSPAAKAGVRIGDRIVRFAGQEFTGGEEFRALAMGASSPVAFVVERPGAEQPLELTAQLVGDPIRVGISWSADDAEPRSVIVLRVVPDSPADRAGIKVDDRIYQVGGKEFSSADEFDHLLMTEAAPIELALESRGQIRHVRLSRNE